MACVVVATLFFCWLALDGHHYWHEARFVFAVTQFPMTAVLDGSFNPHQVGQVIDEIESSGFYSTKILHMVWLRTIFSVLPPSDGGWNVSVFASLLSVLAAGWIAGRILRKIDPHGPDQLVVFGVFLAVPASAYLAGKLLSEVTSLPLIAMSIGFLINAVNRTGPQRLGNAAAAAIFLAGSALARLDMTLCYGAFVAAYAIAGPDVAARRKMLVLGFITTISAAAAYFVVLKLANVNVGAIWHYFKDYINLDKKSIVMSLLSLGSFGGFVYILGIYACVRHRERIVFPLLWVAGTMIPMSLVTSNYMIEPRYLATALIPLAALGSYGLPDRLPKARVSKLGILLSCVLVILLHKFVIGLMPYELDRPELEAAVESVQSRDDDPVILVPWSYTDYHWLRVMYPNVRLYNVYVPGGDPRSLDNAWRQRFERWYPGRWLGSPEALEDILAPGESAWYVGWHTYPPLNNLLDAVRRLSPSLVRKIGSSLNLQDHMTESWVWAYADLAQQVPEKFGQYEIRAVPASIQSSDR